MNENISPEGNLALFPKNLDVSQRRAKGNIKIQTRTLECHMLQLLFFFLSQLFFNF